MKKKLLIVALLLFVKGFGQNITVSPNAYTPSQLVSEILVKNSCLAQVTNITKTTGTDYGYAQGNGIAYFQNTNPNFPITSGVLLSTGNAAAAQGPNTTISSFTAPAWAGDADLNAALLAQGITITSRNATVLEFDFTAVTSTFSVDFLFASEEYGTYQCTSKDAFAFLLTNLNTNVTTNVAVVPSTNQPISVATISNTLYNSACGVNPQFFGLFNGGSSAAASATNFEGQTVLLNALHTLVPGNQYHIKLVIADDAGANGTDGDYDSAVFFPEGSFNLGHQVVGEDLTAENGTGLCNDEVHVINTGLSETTYDLSWTKDGAPVAGGSSISISETGTYVLTIHNPATNCTVAQTLIAEAAAPILANTPQNLLACGNASGSYVYDLSLNTPVIKEGLNPGTVVTYHTTEAAANANTGALPALYTSPGNQTIWARVKSYNSDCYVLVSFQLLIVEPPVANQPQNLTQCSINGGGTTAIFNLTTQNATILGAQSASENTITYYTTMANAVNNTNAITSPGNYTSANQTIYARIQRNFSVSCYAITNFTITVAPKPVIPDPADVFTCDNYVLPALANGAQYFTAPGGTGTMVPAGTSLTISQTLYVYKQADTPPYCANENSFAVNISSTSIVTPGNAYACQSYTMPVPPTGSFYYTGPGGTGTQIAAGTVITSTQIIYFYVPAAPYCTQNDHFTVLVTPNPVIPNPGNMNLCQPYTLPALTVGNYYTGPAGTGTIIPAGTVISATQAIYIYATTPGGLNNTCTSQSVFTVNITNVTLPPFANVTNCGPYELPELTLGAYFTGPNGTGTPLAAGSLISSSQTVYVYEASPANPACANQQSFTVTINPLPVLAPFPEVIVCGSYTLPALPTGASYYTFSGGVGPIAVGTVLVESQMVYIQSAQNQFGCVRERALNVIVIGDEADNPGDQSVCDSYTLPGLPIGDYYTGPGATGDLLQPGTVLTQSQIVYVYVVSETTPVCTAESDFIVTITPQPVVPEIADVIACTSYTLPALPSGVAYRTGPGGTGTVLPAGSPITSTQTIYVFKQSGGTPNCTAETDFTVTIITGSVAPANVTVCSSGYTLPELAMGNYYNQPNGAGPVVAPGTLVTTTKTLYVYVPTTSGTNCTSNNSFTITVLPPVLADNPPDVIACGSYTIPQATNGNYYSFSNGSFTLVPAGTVITTSTPLYVINTNPTHPECRVQYGVHITITGPTVQDLPDQTVCDGYVLPVLSSGTYYTQSGGTGQVILPGTNITTTQTIYIYAQTGTTLICSDEENFTVTILPSPQIAPSAVVAACGNYILPALTVGNYYTGTNGTGTLLAAGQSISATQNVYIYAPAGGQFSCSAQSTLQIIINPQAPPNVSACDSYVLPALAFGNYFTGPAGTGTPKFAGNVITTTQNMYVYVATGTAPNCTDNNFFNIAINQTPVLPAIESTIVRCDAYELPALSVGNYYTGPGGTGSLLSAGSLITSSQTVYVYAQTGTAPNCTAEASINITIHVTPLADARSAVEICDSYTLTPLVTGNYFALPGGPNVPGQTAYSAGNVITQSMEMYIYAVSATSSACFSQNSFTITIQSIDADNPGPHEDCDSYTLPVLNQGDYYTLSGGPDVTGQVLMHAGDVITQSVTLYIYAELGGRLNCNDEHVLPITIYQTPVVDDTQTDLSTCFTYTLPPLTVGNYFTAPNGGGTPLAAGSQITQSQNIYIYAATGSATKTCSDEHMYHVTVNSIDVPEIADLYACESFTLEPLAVGNYFTQPGGQGTLLTAGTVITETQTIYIYGETNTIPNCTDESDFVITIVQPPLPTTPDALSTCALDLSGHGSFNLTPAMQQALNGQPDVAVSIYETLADATFGTNAITNSTAYTNIFAFNQTLHIRLESTLAPGCITLVTLQLIANPKPIATEPSAPYQLCDNGASDTDGLAIFDLTTYSTEVLGNLSPTLFSVSYYANLANADAGTNPISSPANYLIGTTTVFIRVTNNATGCYDIVELELIVNPLPVVNNPTPLTVCDDNDPDNETEEFDLTIKIDEIIGVGTLGLNVTFHTSYADAQGNTNAIANPDAYTNTAAVETLFVRVTNAITGCYRIVLLDVRVEPLPEVLDPTEEDLTVCDTNGMGVGTFNLLELVDGLINGGGANLSIHFYETAIDAANGLNEIPNPASYQNPTPFLQPIYVVVENATTGCQSNAYEFFLIVAPAPQAPALEDIVDCDDYDNNDQDGKARVDLTVQNQVIYDALNIAAGDQDSIIIHYFTSEEDADADINMITNATQYTATNEQVIWVRVEDAETGCYSLTSFQVILNKPVDLIQPTPLVLCEDGTPNDGKTIFDLTVKNTEILGPMGIGMGNVVTYYTTQADALAGTNPIPTPEAYTNTSNAQTLFVEVTTPAGCKSYITLTIRVLPLPVPNMNPTALEKCDDISADGTETFNLTDAAAQILANDTLSQLSYWPTEEDANNGTNEILTPTAWPSATGSVWVKVSAHTTNATDPVCYVLVELNLIVNPLPATGTIAPYAICQLVYTGTATFDFNTHIDEILGAGVAPEDYDDYTLTFYFDAAAQAAGTPLPYIYDNVSTPQTILVEVVNTVTGCTNTASFVIAVEQQAIANPVTQATLDTYFDLCDTDGSNDGYTEFDLTQATADIIGTQSPAANYTVTYYETQADALAGTNAIPTPAAYTNTTQNEQMIVAAISDTTTVSGCISYTTFSVKAEILAEPVISTPGDDHTICVDFKTGQTVKGLTLNSGITTAGNTYKWFLDGVEVTLDPSASTYEAVEAGNYTVEVTGPAPNFCVSGVSAAFNVIQSGTAVKIGEGYVVSNAFNENQTITVLVEGYGEYQYSLYPEGPWQNSNVFTNVPMGEQTIYVRDVKTTNSCDIFEIPAVSIIDYPHFFTPNGDGYHDTWNIVGLKNYPEARIFIFDRYGKLLKQLSPESDVTEGEGWDGTYNGQPVPSDDYWFTVTYPDGNVTKEFKAHFSLKR